MRALPIGGVLGFVVVLYAEQVAKLFPVRQGPLRRSRQPVFASLLSQHVVAGGASVASRCRGGQLPRR